MGYNETKGKDVLRLIRKDKVPAYKPVTYPRFTVAYRPEKADSYRICITAGRDKLIHDGETANYGAGMTTIKTILNSVVLHVPGNRPAGPLIYLLLQFPDSREHPEAVQAK